MIFFERIQKIIDYYKIKSVNSFAKDYLKYKSSEKINRLKGKDALPSYEILHDISIKFENINPDWLLTGRGEMLRDTTSIVQELPPIYMKSETCEKCAEKEKLIQSMQKTIDTQSELIDCLQTLKNNCKQPEKKSQTSSQFPNISANIK